MLDSESQTWNFGRVLQVPGKYLSSRQMKGHLEATTRSDGAAGLAHSGDSLWEQEVRTHLPFDADSGVCRLNVHVNKGGVQVSGGMPSQDFNRLTSIEAGT